MEYSGPEPLVNIEADLALSEDDDLSQEHWPKLNPPGHRKLAPTAAVPQPMDHATISTKRRMEPDSAVNHHLLWPKAPRVTRLHL
ncbi:hypothetical protein Pcinc_005686 [Petrolisthes cinctipes]|uniref:Uncharacterized protein n=1 Tax=Petrolisthes cinctipes TaxID=88211 RepID=A0AAE1KZU1_PETCI|nr:hypothetical protein Pcinc_005686 [Petrolisthes cinctipes]